MAFWRTYYHLVWATKNRQPLITPAIEAQLFPRIVHKAEQIGVTVYAINGWTDHIHLVVSIPPKLSVAEVVKDLKGVSSRSMNVQAQAEFYAVPHFNWQEGYGVLTIGKQHYPLAVEYVKRQKEHHANRQTNFWLERTEEADAGPHDFSDTPPSGKSRTLRETPAFYGSAPEEDDFPF